MQEPRHAEAFRYNSLGHALCFFLLVARVLKHHFIFFIIYYYIAVYVHYLTILRLLTI